MRSSVLEDLMSVFFFILEICIDVFIIEKVNKLKYMKYDKKIFLGIIVVVVVFSIVVILMVWFFVYYSVVLCGKKKFLKCCF